MTVGAQLRQAREEQRLSIADVSRDTKIQPWMLEALEADRFHESMSPVYVKGFLTTYARFLRLSAEPLLAQVPSLQPQEAPEEIAASAMPPAIPFSLQLRIPWAMLKRLRVPALVAVGIATLIVVNPLRWLPSMSLLHRQASVSVMSELATKPVSREHLATIPTQILELSVSVRRPTWIRVRADGRLLAQQQLQVGDQETWTAAEQFELIVAKPSQVDVTLNGQLISPLAIAHRGRLLITREGIRRLPEQD